jgi:hypothetical protein
MPTVKQHEQVLHLVVAEELPPHEKRTESALFRKNKKLLVKDHKLPCFACKAKSELQVHHMVEWATWNWIDTNKMVDRLSAFDPYGFSKMYHGKDIESPDDIRNLIVLCQPCHTGAGKGIHFVPLPIWLPQACVQEGHSFEDSALHEELKRRNASE